MPNHWYVIRISGLILFLTLCSVAAQGQQSPFIAYTTEDGLAQSQIRAIQQDYRGYLWVGSLGGLTRFDGVSFANYSSQDGLISNKVNCLYRGNKHLWVGTTGGISRLSGDVLTPVPLPDAFAKSEVLDLIETSDSALWIALSGDGLLRYHQGVFEAFAKQSGLDDLFIRALEVDHSGRLWVGSKSGVHILTDQGFKNQSAFANISVSDLTCLGDGSMIVSSFGSGIIKASRRDTISYTTDNGLPSNHIRCAIELNGRIWLGSRKGLIKWQGSEFSLLTQEEGLPYANVKSLGRDSENNLWIGTDGNGLLLSTGNQFLHFDTSDGLLSNLVLSIAKGASDEFYVGTYNSGLQLFKSGVFSDYAFNTEFSGQSVWCIRPGQDGSVWIGATMGLYCDEQAAGGGLKHFLKGKEVTAIATADAGIAVGIDNGLLVLNTLGIVIDSLKTCAGKSIRNVRSILYREGTLWIGAQGCVAAYRNSNCTIYPVDDKEETAVYSLVSDAYGNVWVGTSNGIYMIHTKEDSLIKVPFSKKISANNVNFLTWTGRTKLVAGTNNGLYEIHVSDFPKNEAISVRQYGAFEGLRSAETNQNALYNAGDSLWFGTTSGLVCFFPEKVLPEIKPPLLDLSNVQLFGQQTDWKAFGNSGFSEGGLPMKPVLTHNKNALTFSFSGIHFSNPEKISYRYMMEGIEQQWIGPTKERSVTYAYLPHGTFTFRVEAYHEEWPGAVAQSAFEFEIKPPFYLTWWFFLLSAVGIGLALYAIYKNQIDKERKKQQAEKLMYQSKMVELESLALNSSMNRHFIFNALNSIQYYINVQDKRSANKYLSSFARLIRKNLDSSQQNETSLQDELDRIGLYLSLEEMRFQGRFEYLINIGDDINARDVQIPSMMLQPYLENSIWHGVLPSEKAGKIDVSIKKDAADMLIEITDNGIGIDTSLKNKPEELNGHHSRGMVLTKNRMELFHKMTGQNYIIIGPFEIIDDQGITQGTKVSIRIPQQISENAKENLVDAW